MATFDIYDKSSWYFGTMSRTEATDLLMKEREGGVFLVRDSTTILGDYVLCVREDTKVSHYIINKIQQGDQVVFRIGDQSFSDMPELLGFYKLHYLDTTPLRRPAMKKQEKVICKFDFEGSGDQEDLPFKKGEILYIISKDEDQWWTARNSLGATGQIPVNYVETYDSELRPSGVGFQPISRPSNGEGTFRRTNLNRKLPAFARVKQARVPNAYDKTALKLEIGDVIKVTKMNINGQWEGELNGKIGFFPFTHIEFLSNDDEDSFGNGNGNHINDEHRDWGD